MGWGSTTLPHVVNAQTYLLFLEPDPEVPPDIFVRTTAPRPRYSVQEHRGGVVCADLYLIVCASVRALVSALVRVLVDALMQWPIINMPQKIYNISINTEF